MDELKQDVEISALYHGVEQTLRSIIREVFDPMEDKFVEKVMAIFKPFIEERLNQYTAYMELRKEAMSPTVIQTGKEEAIKKTIEWMRSRKYQRYSGGPMERLIDEVDVEQYLKYMEA